MAARIVDTIKTDHREIVDYYSKVLNSTSNKEKVQWQNQFTWELARHSIAEELVVYPQLEKKLADGRAMAEKDRNEHQTVINPAVPSYRYSSLTIQCRSKSS